MARSKTILVGEELDRLGVMGENRFKDLCDRARLQVSRPIPDKTGKDFIVEFPLEPFSALVPYDKRKPPLKIAVQVKTVSSDDRPAVLALNVAERLARDADPAVICLFIYDERSDDLIEMRLIHILGDNLARIMRRLRQASEVGKRALHKLTVSFPQTTGFVVAMRPTELSEALSSLVIPDMETYAAEKLHQVRTVGYPANRLMVSFSFSDLSEDEVVDAFLGLTKLTLDTFEVKERRFDIELPAPEFGPFTSGGIMRLQPDPIGHCRLVASVAADGVVHEADAKIFVVPAGLAGSEATYLFKWSMGSFKLILSRMTCKLKIDLDMELIQPINVWKNELRFLHCLISEDCAVHARGHDLDVHLADVRWPDANDLEWVESADRIVAAFFEVFDEAGAKDECLSLEALLSDRRTIAILHVMCSRNIKLTSNSEGWIMPKLDGTSGLYITAAEVAGFWIGLALPMDFWTQRSGKRIDWTCYKSGEPIFQLLEGETKVAFERFRKNAQKLARPECTFVQTPGNFLAHDGMILDTELISDHAEEEPQLDGS